MREILRFVAEQRKRLEDHAFFSWVRHSAVPLERKLDFAPIMANFVMNFRDMNLWFIRFAEGSDDFKAVINGNTVEDETHSRLFLEDWRKLRLDEKLGWRSSDMLWWLFLAPDTEPMRSFAFDFARMTVVDGGDPLLRFAHSEAGETCGNVFFENLTPLARLLEQSQAREYRYFGDYHLNRERGHVIASEGVFDAQVLDEETRRRGIALARAMFNVFFAMHDSFHAYAETYVTRDVMPQRPRSLPRAFGFHPIGNATPAKPQAIFGRNAVVQAALEKRKARTARHPFFAWLEHETALSPRQRLARFIPMWVMDIMGYRDLNRYALRFREPSDVKQIAYNRWVDTLETHSALFMHDWDALGMDEALGWNASETLDFLFLDPHTDVHRRNIASFIKLAIAHESTSLRFWLLEALEASGEAFFATTRKLAVAVERSMGVRLDYLADRHELAHPAADGIDARRGYPFKSEPLSERDAEIAVAMVHTVFDAVDEQFTLSHELAMQNYFKIGRASKRVVLPPVDRAEVRA